jgi:hypothetical protein
LTPLLRAVWVAAVATLLQPAGAAAQGGERIVDFESRIEVHADATMSVTETITVVSAGRKIKRGIYRDFPTTYRDRNGRTVIVGFEVLEIRRDGRPEPYRLSTLANGVRVHIGDRNVFIPHGEHSYTIVYRTDRQLGFFEAFDEFYWNVTGNGWDFPIEQARAFVTLPEGAEVLDSTGYTGRQGERGQDFIRLSAPGGADIAFATTRRLSPREGFTIAVSWPKGFVAEPTQIDKLGYLLRDNADSAVGAVGLLVVLLYYLAAWHKVGRDPEKGTIIPKYAPPKGISPAAARYLMRTTFDDKAFTAAIMSLAVKGHIRIVEDGDGGFSLYRQEFGGDPLSRGEKAVFRKMFGDGRGKLVLERDNHATLQSAHKALRSTLRTDFEQTYFLRNTWFFVPGLAITAITIVAAAGLATQLGTVLVVGALGAVLCLIGYIVWRGALAALRRELTSIRSLMGVAMPAAFLVAFFSFAPSGLFDFFDASVPVAAVPLLAIIVLNFVFYHLLKAPTRLGRRVMDKIEGFELYLSVAEKDRMNLLNPPEHTPELFEKFLPYALALGVEQAWSEGFADVLSAASRDPERDGHDGYHPHWYSGRSFRSDRIGSFSSGLAGGLSSAIASASTPPGSSSGMSGGGFSGGGFSGGGGGGGGGGGW